MSSIGPAFVTVIGLVIGAAIVALLVSKNAQTPQVFQAGGSALASIINAAVSPVTQSNQFGSTSGTSG